MTPYVKKLKCGKEVTLLRDEEAPCLIEQSWYFETLFDGLPPVPKFSVRCPVCGEEDLIYLKGYRCFERAVGRYRCDVWFKCGRCAYTWVHGVHIPESIYRNLTDNLRYGDYLKWGGHVLVKKIQRELGLLP